mmetsp:Transcript_3792/g.11246  ORF Transcript_3792/g.11246 Transcript_3792/m.11246 type:complete len:264 (-) Transcript_3792:288-1079(-)
MWLESDEAAPLKRVASSAMSTSTISSGSAGIASANHFGRSAAVRRIVLRAGPSSRAARATLAWSSESTYTAPSPRAATLFSVRFSARRQSYRLDVPSLLSVRTCMAVHSGPSGRAPSAARARESRSSLYARQPGSTSGTGVSDASWSRSAYSVPNRSSVAVDSRQRCNSASKRAVSRQATSKSTTRPPAGEGAMGTPNARVSSTASTRGRDRARSEFLLRSSGAGTTLGHAPFVTSKCFSSKGSTSVRFRNFASAIALRSAAI